MNVEGFDIILAKIVKEFTSWRGRECKFGEALRVDLSREQISPEPSGGLMR